jgi:rhodanese-related sulfurtransferase
VTVAELLDASRTGVSRPGPVEASAARGAGALLVDIRPEPYRREEGEIPGSLVLERNVLEWRLDPASPDRCLDARGRQVILICNEGYASSLAAVSLRSLGLDATDLDGGFRGWLAAGLPSVSGPTAPGEYVSITG